jgi:DNA-binding PucR family transcriptional regulator
MATSDSVTVEATTWDAFVDALQRECATSVEQTVAGMRALASYADIPRDALRAVVRRNHHEILAGMRLRRPPEPLDATTIFSGLGEVRARQGVAVSDMLAAWRMGQEGLYALATRLAPVTLGRDALLREFLELEVRWVDFAMLAAADGHRRAELSLAREQEHAQADLIRRVMTGAAAPAEIRRAFAAAGLDPDAGYRAVRARSCAPVELHEIERYLGVDLPASRGAGIAARIDGELCGLVTRLPHTAAPVPMGISEPVAAHEFPRAFRQAGRALDVALRLGANGTFDLDGLGLRPAIVADADVGSAMVRRYLEPLEATTGGDAVLATVERFLDNDGNAEVTARELGVHVNTVRHRLSRFEEASGRSLRATETLAEVWWAFQHRHLS